MTGRSGGGGGRFTKGTAITYVTYCLTGFKQPRKNSLWFLFLKKAVGNNHANMWVLRKQYSIANANIIFGGKLCVLVPDSADYMALYAVYTAQFINEVIKVLTCLCFIK